MNITIDGDTRHALQTFHAGFTEVAGRRARLGRAGGGGGPVYYGCPHTIIAASFLARKA